MNDRVADMIRTQVVGVYVESGYRRNNYWPSMFSPISKEDATKALLHLVEIGLMHADVELICPLVSEPRIFKYSTGDDLLKMIKKYGCSHYQSGRAEDDDDEEHWVRFVFRMEQSWKDEIEKKNLMAI